MGGDAGGVNSLTDMGKKDRIILLKTVETGVPSCLVMNMGKALLERILI